MTTSKMSTAWDQVYNDLFCFDDEDDMEYYGKIKRVDLEPCKQFLNSVEDTMNKAKFVTNKGWVLYKNGVMEGANKLPVKNIFQWNDNEQSVRINSEYLNDPREIYAVYLAIESVWGLYSSEHEYQLGIFPIDGLFPYDSDDDESLPESDDELDGCSGITSSI